MQKITRRQFLCAAAAAALGGLSACGSTQPVTESESIATSADYPAWLAGQTADYAYLDVTELIAETLKGMASAGDEAAAGRLWAEAHANCPLLEEISGYPDGINPDPAAVAELLGSVRFELPGPEGLSAQQAANQAVAIARAVWGSDLTPDQIGMLCMDPVGEDIEVGEDIDESRRLWIVRLWFTADVFERSDTVCRTRIYLDAITGRFLPLLTNTDVYGLARLDENSSSFDRDAVTQDARAVLQAVGIEPAADVPALRTPTSVILFGADGTAYEMAFFENGALAYLGTTNAPDVIPEDQALLPAPPERPAGSL